MVLLDGLRLDALDVHPVFDELKRRGLFCGNMVTYAPYTTASMHAILTGIYGTRNGVDAYLSAAKYRASACRTLSQIFQAAGFSTAVDINNRNTIPCQGIERVMEYDEFHPDNRFRLFDRHRNLLDETFRSRKPALLALHNLKTHAELILQFKSTFAGEREPLYFEDPSRNERAYRTYAHDMGEYLVALLAELDRLQFFRDGLLVVYSDHGCSYGERPGERMYGTYLHDYTIRTFASFIGGPFVPGERRDDLLRTVDIAPTLLDAFGLPFPADALEPDGRSFLRAGDAPRWGFVETAPLGGDAPSPDAPNYHGVVSARQKLLYHSGRDVVEYVEHDGNVWAPQSPDTPQAREWLLHLCACSPRVNRKWLAKQDG